MDQIRCTPQTPQQPHPFSHLSPSPPRSVVSVYMQPEPRPRATVKLPPGVSMAATAVMSLSGYLAPLNTLQLRIGAGGRAAGAGAWLDAELRNLGVQGGGGGGGC